MIRLLRPSFALRTVTELSSLNMVNTNGASPANGSQSLCFYIPSPLHPQAYTRCEELGVDVIHPKDSRSQKWYEYADAVVLRQGRVAGDYGLAKKLKIIARNGTGYDMVNVPRCKELGIAVTNLPGFNAEAVAELTYGLAISVSRRIVEFDRRLRAGETVPSAHNIGLSFYKKTVGLVGMGDCAREVALKFYHASKCRILVYSPTSPRTRWTTESTMPNEPVIPHTRVNSLEELLKESDVVSLHCPAVPGTFKMMSDKQFEIMKDSAIFLNLGRGELVDEEALFRACKTRKIFGAGLDCFAVEPVTSATYGDTLFTLGNVVVLPHVGATTLEVTRDSTVTAVETAYTYCTRGDIGASTLIRELEWSDLSRKPNSTAADQ